MLTPGVPALSREEALVLLEELTELQERLDGLHGPRPHAGGALVLLIVAVTLSVYKPRGMTRYGQRKQQERRVLSRP